MESSVPVASKQQATLSVAVRVRPLLKAEGSPKKDIVRVIDKKIVVVLDPDETKGLNGTVFAYGATGSGKTHTMVGTPSDPGLMVRSLAEIFQQREALAPGRSAEDFSVVCSYLEVYNEVIYDLLLKNSGPLELREDPDQGVCVAGLKRIQVSSPEEIMGLLEEGNKRRKTDSTDANATSSRSHAVLEILVRRVPRDQYRAQALLGKLSLVDLAGSERAAETNNVGQKLRDGANINRSLLALANCINALGKNAKTGAAYVPYRNSKLTRLLKDGLSGNSRTAMVATVAAAGDQYYNSVNTLKYADRAKEIKTHVVPNLGSVERHISDYQSIIDTLQTEVQSLRAKLAPAGDASSGPSFTGSPGAGPHGAAAPRGPGAGAAQSPADAAGKGGAAGAGAGGSGEADTLSWLDALATEINENVEERINLQKALYELEDINVCNKYELQNIQEMLDAGSATDAERAEALERRAALQEEVSGNEAEAQCYRDDIAANEAGRREIQGKLEAAIDGSSNANFLKILSTFRIQAVRLQELKFQMAVRDQIISEQREVISNVWRILGASGLTREEL
ncbi:hypothetical protein MNEG_8594 [Monoraphidium neglectum]|uniref:Kinesin-like protein n=1 Tax=Monoraphidium neglectum TaxID=145388 RepID=A0A0D2MF46_9CHLO|nr:hypothetical protein MNEG_8594 [Monoraphidium neglectum]KIY99366.1 hypothetical protein MNEG_8594 [Monoraphidium neglectum]|eukprot:XP_013898386.1 hypothetical protein MNEG_8594 [Monoraphidium neglectum]